MWATLAAPPADVRFIDVFRLLSKTPRRLRSRMKSSIRVSHVSCQRSASDRVGLNKLTANTIARRIRSLFLRQGSS